MSSILKGTLSRITNNTSAGRQNIEAKDVTVNRNLNVGGNTTLNNTIINNGLGIGITEPDRDLHVYNNNDSAIKIESNTSTALLEIQSDLTADTFVTTPNIKSKNETQVRHIYKWNSDGSTSSWYAGVGKDEIIENPSDTVRYRIGTSNTLGSSKLVITQDGNVGISTTTPTQLLDINGDTIRLRTRRSIANSSFDGSAGEICFDNNYAYFCVADNTWGRVDLSLTWGL